MFLENKSGKVIRTFLWDGCPLFVVKSLETGRVHLWTESVKKAQGHKTHYEVLTSLLKTLPKKGLKLSDIGVLKMGKPSIYSKLQFDVLPLPHPQSFYAIYFLVFIFMMAFLSLILQASRPDESVFFKKEMKARIVKIKKNIKRNKSNLISVKRLEPIVKKSKNTEAPSSLQNKMARKNIQKNIGTTGVLGLLENVKNHKQNVRLDLNTVKTSLYGAKSSSSAKNGVQHNLYASSIFSAPVVSGGTIQGGGVYKTKGKGGGQVNYGRLSIVTSSRKGSSFLQRMSGSNEGEEHLDQDAGLSPEQEKALDLFVSQKEGVLKSCYEDSLQVFPRFRGSLFLSWSLNQNATVTNVQMERSTMRQGSSAHIKKFQKCIFDAFKSWVFPSILKDKKLDYMFTFDRSRS